MRPTLWRPWQTLSDGRVRRSSWRCELTAAPGKSCSSSLTVELCSTSRECLSGCGFRDLLASEGESDGGQATSAAHRQMHGAHAGECIRRSAAHETIEHDVPDRRRATLCLRLSLIHI